MATSWEPIAEVLMTERYGRLMARARVLAVSDDEAADLVQEALVKTFSRRRGFTEVAQAEQYVRRTIVSVFADEAGRAVRERSRWRRAARGAPDRFEDPGPAVAASADVGQALARLAPRERACVVLRYLEDLSVREAATQLGLSEGAVKRYTSDGLRRLNAALGTREPLDGPEHASVRVVEGGAR